MGILNFIPELVSDTDGAVRGFVEHRRWHLGPAAGSLALFSLWLAVLTVYFRPVSSVRAAVVFPVLLFILLLFLAMIEAFLFHFAAAMSGAKAEILDLYFLLPSAACPFIASAPLALLALLFGRLAPAVFFLFFILEALAALVLLFSILSAYYELDARRTAGVLVFPAVFGAACFAFCAAAAVFAALLR